MKKIAILITMVLGTLSLTACGKKDKDNIANDLESIGMKTEMDSEAESSNIPEHVDYVVEGIDGASAVTVAAEVDDKGVAAATVYNVVRKEVDEELLKQLANGLFDGEYSYVKPYMHCSLEELELEKQVYDSIYSETTGEDGQKNVSYLVDTYYSKLETLINDYQGSGVSLIEHDGLLYHQEEWNDDSAFWGEDENLILALDSAYKILAADYSRIRGKRDNHTYEIYYEKYYLDYDTQYREGGFECRYDPSRLMIKRMDTPYVEDGTADMEQMPDSNKCDYETALQQAKDVMKDMGFEAWSAVNVEQLYVTPSVGAGSKDLNGYAIWFSNALDDIDLLRYNGGYVMVSGTEHDDEWMYATGQPYIRITVTDAGVHDIDIGDIYSEPIPSEKDIKIFPFEKVDEEAKYQMQFFIQNHNVDRIKLSYVYASYDGSDYCIIPIWVYYEEDTDASDLYGFVRVNALDGQSVDYCYEKKVRGYHPVMW